MTHIESSIHIDAPRDQVWSVLADFGGVQKFHPGLRSSRSTSAANGGVGATRHCELKPTGAVDEVVRSWREGEEMIVDIVAGQGTPPLDTTATRGVIRLRDDGAGTVVSMTLDYRLRLGPIGALLDRAVVRAQFAKTVPRILRGLKVYVERGHKATRDDLRQLAAAA